MYQTFKQETFHKIPLLLGDTNPDEGVHESIKNSYIHKVVVDPIVLPCEETITYIII
jgi:hypothetical protein